MVLRFIKVNYLHLALLIHLQPASAMQVLSEYLSIYIYLIFLVCSTRSGLTIYNPYLQSYYHLSYNIFT